MSNRYSEGLRPSPLNTKTTDFGKDAVEANKEAMTYVTEMKIGSKLFTVTSECSPAATETLEQKLMRIIGRHACETG